MSSFLLREVNDSKGYEGIKRLRTNRKGMREMTSEFAIAVHALVYLHHKNAVLSSEELAENICTNSARVRKVMAKLKKKDLIGTKEGIKGGYHMSLDAPRLLLGISVKRCRWICKGACVQEVWTWTA